MLDGSQEEDSDDLTDDEVGSAIPTLDANDLARQVVGVLKDNPGWWIEAHELRRRKPHLYYRLRLAGPTSRTIVYRASWLLG